MCYIWDLKLCRALKICASVFLERTASNQRPFSTIPEQNRAKKGAKQILNQDCVSVSTFARWSMTRRSNPTWMDIRT
jgi:hypothetical protein